MDEAEKEINWLLDDERAEYAGCTNAALTLVAALDALRNDAARYRKLRDSPIADVRIIGVGKRSGAGLDEAVDTMYTAPAVG